MASTRQHGQPHPRRVRSPSRSTRGPDAAGPRPAGALWKASYRQSRSMIRDGGRHGLGARYVHCLGHLRRRFGSSGWPVCQRAAALALDLRAVSKAATGTREELAREGMLTRCVRLEAAPRGLGWLWAFTFDALGSPNTARSLRRGRTIRLRQDRARCAEVARAMAADRHRIGRGPFFITDLGRAVLADATAHA